MRRIIGSICLSLFCLGVAWVEYRMVLHVRSILILFAVVPLLGAVSVALVRAPEGYERSNGFYVRTCDRRLSPIRRVRLFQPVCARGWRWRSERLTYSCKT
jgi:hypothetical protein